MGVIDCLEIIILTLINHKRDINWIKIFIALTFMILLMIFCDLNKDIKNNIQIRAQEISSYSYLNPISDSESSLIEEEK